MMHHQQQEQQQWPSTAAAPPAGYYQQQKMWNQQQMPPIAANQEPYSNEMRTLWVGELQPWMDESYLLSCFSHTGGVLTTKIIRNKHTQQSEGYGFIEFVSHASAEHALQNFNGQSMPNANLAVFKLNWASNGAGEKRTDVGPDYSIFVGDLAADVTDVMLMETFKSHYSSVKSAKVVIDRLTQHSKGYGFVSFGDSNEQTRAMSEMNGVYCSTRPMRIGAAANKKTFGAEQQFSSNVSYQSSQGSESENDPNNTTIFVGGLDPNVSEDLLRQVFSPCGELVYVKIPEGKRCGFVQYANRANAEEALKLLNGTLVGGQNIRLSWGRSLTNKQPQQNWNGNFYGYCQSHGAYGHAPPRDPNMYTYAAYQGYTGYPQQQ